MREQAVLLGERHRKAGIRQSQWREYALFHHCYIEGLLRDDLDEKTQHIAGESGNPAFSPGWNSNGTIMSWSTNDFRLPVSPMPTPALLQHFVNRRVAKAAVK